MRQTKVKVMLALAVLGLACAEGAGARRVGTPTNTGPDLQALLAYLESLK